MGVDDLVREGAFASPDYDWLEKLNTHELHAVEGTEFIADGDEIKKVTVGDNQYVFTQIGSTYQTRISPDRFRDEGEALLNHITQNTSTRRIILMHTEDPGRLVASSRKIPDAEFRNGTYVKEEKDILVHVEVHE